MDIQGDLNVSGVITTLSGLWAAPNMFLGFRTNGTERARFDHVGNLSCSGTLHTIGQIQQPDGSVTVPSYSFGKDTNTGIYRIGDNILGVTANGVEVVRVGAGALTISHTSNPASLTISNSTATQGDTIIYLKKSNDGNSAYVSFGDQAGEHWQVGTGISADDDVFRIRDGAAGTVALAVAQTTLAATFGGAVTLNGPTLTMGAGQLLITPPNSTTRYAVITAGGGHANGMTQFVNSAVVKGEIGCDFTGVFVTGGSADDMVILATGNFWVAKNSDGTPMLKLTQTGAATFGATITTAAPTGGAGVWKLGIANAVSPTSPNRTITIDIGGTLYYLHAKTTND